MDAHGQRSSDVVKTSFHENLSILPLENGSEILENDRRRCGQTYPGSVSRHFWTVLQSSSTCDGMLLQHYIKLLHLHTTPLL